MRHCSAKLNQNDKRKMMKGLYIVPLAAATFTIGRLCYNGKTDLCVSDSVSIFELPATTKCEYNRIQQYIDNGVQTPKSTGMGVGLGLGGGWGRGGWGFGPSISVNMGQSSSTKNTELSRVLGQQEAIVQAAQFKNCPIIVRKKTN